MEKIRKYLFLSLLSQTFANMVCEDLPGVWWGMMQDKTHLLLDDSVPVIFNVEKKDNQYIGQFQFMHDVPSITSRIWMADCDNGVLSNVYFVDPTQNSCGIASKDISLENTLKMTVNWQNAMMDAELAVRLVPLQKKPVITPDSLSKRLPQTCH